MNKNKVCNKWKTLRLTTETLLLILLFVGVASSDPIPAGPIAEYHFNGNALDSSGNGNDGTINGGATFVPGKYGQALSFDGVDDYVEISTLGDPTISDWTLGAWIKLPSGSTEVNPIIAKRNEINDLSLTLRTFEDKAECIIEGPYISHGYQSSKSINDGNWHSLTCTRQGINIYLYVDGILDNGLVLNYNPYGQTFDSITSTSKLHW